MVQISAENVRMSFSKVADTSDSELSSSSMSSLRMTRGRSRERSRSQDVLERASRESSYSWRQKFNKALQEESNADIKKIPNEISEDSKKDQIMNTHKDNPRRRLSLISECFNQSPSLNILQIKLDGENRLQSNKTKSIKAKSPISPLIQEKPKPPMENIKDIEKSTCTVDVQVKREIFEGKVEGKPKVKRGSIKGGVNESQPNSKSPRENWNAIREKHCPLTASLVNDNKGEPLKSSILVSDKKISFKNIRFSKKSKEDDDSKQQKLGEVTASKEFEDRATAILQEMRKQRRTLQMEYVTKVTLPTPKRVDGWRVKLNHDDDKKSPKLEKKQSPTTKKKLVNRTVGGKEKPNSFISVQVKDDKVKESEMTDQPKNKFPNPLDFILMKEEIVKKNPPKKKTFVKERSVESESEGEMSMASVMKSLKKIVKAINPKREFPLDVEKVTKKYDKKIESEEKEKKSLREKILTNSVSMGGLSSWDERMKKYQGASIVPFNRHSSRWNSCQDLPVLEEQRVVDKKAVRERIQNRVLSSINHGDDNIAEDNFIYCDSKDFSVKGQTSIKVSKYKLPKIATQEEIIPMFECIEFRRRELPDIIAHFNKDKEKIKKKSVHVKPTIHGLTDSKHSFALVTRTNAVWETVKPINVEVKKKTELFAPKATPAMSGRAKVIMECLCVAVVTSPGTSGTTAYCEQHKWNNMKGCALFSVAGEVNYNFPTGKENKVIVVNMPVEALLGEDVAKTDHVFTKCERKPQSQLVQVGEISTF